MVAYGRRWEGRESSVGYRRVPKETGAEGRRWERRDREGMLADEKGFRGNVRDMVW